MNPNEGRPIAQIRFEGLKRVSETFVRNQVRSAEGRPLEWAVVREDLRRLERLGEFRSIRADLDVQADRSVVVVYTVVEAPIIKDIQIVGNREVTDEDVANVVNLVVGLISGVPVDDFRIGQAKRAIEELYRSRGYYAARVEVDESELEAQGNVLFRIREGERIRVTDIRLEGNRSVDETALRRELNTKLWGLFNKGAVDDQVLDRDVRQLITAYRDRGFLDVRVSRRIQPSLDGKEAIVVFLIDEGPLYVLRDLAIVVETGRAGARDPAAAEGPGLEAVAAAGTVFSVEQVSGLMTLKRGGVFGARPLRESLEAVRDAYLKMGYVDVRVNSEELRDTSRPEVDLKVLITEGRRYRAGVVVTRGNDITQSKVVRREIDLQPGVWLDGTQIKESEERLTDTGLFERNPAVGKPPKLTIQPEDPANPGHRDVLAEVTETNTGKLGFGVGASSDAGLFGVITLEQNNFDIADTPDSFDEFVRGRAFRGAGQRLEVSAQPGIDQSSYSVQFTEPSLFETPYSLGSGAYFTDFKYNEFKEQRLGGNLRVARRFGTQWTGGVKLRAEHINLSDISRRSAVDIFDVQGGNNLTSVGADLQRTTLDKRLRPSQGSLTSLAVEQVGALGGDFSFTKLAASHTSYFTVFEDALGRKSTISFTGRLGLIPQKNEAPVFERYYMGGRSFRGFDFRGIGPVGVRRDTGLPGNDKVGGRWSVFLGSQFEQPLIESIISVVFFVDSGTLRNDIGLGEYRVSVGTGLRLYLPQLGQAPFAFDFAVPVKRQSTDDRQLFSFSVEIPF
ncbi:MAG: BamA/TamA family outer membrane protein [Phycisphaerales bacterium]|nr:BamA/TamA family outer membrane protein [Phycisphaerales bacterium]